MTGLEPAVELMPIHKLSALGIHVLERGWLSSNCILFSHDVPTLVDSGYHTHANQTVAWIRSLLTDRPLDRLMNTHLHSDHCGGNLAVQNAYPDVCTFVPHNSANAVRAWVNDDLTFEATGQECPVFRMDNTLCDQQLINLAGLTWKVHAAKGHDPDAILLFQEDHRILISADALWENGFGVVFPELSNMQGFGDAEQTLDLIESLAPSLVIPGHGTVFTNVADALTRARQRLHYFVKNPDKHVRYALKVLIKFKLLEWQSVSFVDLLRWCQSTPYVKERMPNNPANFPIWLECLMDELERSRAARREGEMLHNI